MNLNYLLRILVAIFAIYLLVRLSNTEQVFHAVGKASLFWVLIGVVVFLAGQLIASQRWRLVLLIGGVDLPPISVYKLHLIGIFSSNFLPGQATGDVIKAMFLYDSYPDRKSFLIASVVYDRLLGLFALLTLALVASGVLALRDMDPTIMLFVFGGFLVLLIIVIASRQINRLAPLAELLGSRSARGFTGFSNGLSELLRLRKLALSSFSLGLMFQLSWAICLFLMSWAVSPGMYLLPVLIAAPLAVLVASLPISIGGLGVREGAFVLIMQQLGVNAEVAAAAALLAILPLLFASIVGAIILHKYDRFHYSKEANL